MTIEETLGFAAPSHLSTRSHDSGCTGSRGARSRMSRDRRPHARKGSGPSDHAPVIVDLDEAPDGDIGPVVSPPSAPATRKVTLPQSRRR